MTTLALKFNLTFQELYSQEGCQRLQDIFLAELKAADDILYGHLLDAYHTQPADSSALILLLAPHLEDFIAKLFNIEHQVTKLAEEHHSLAALHKCKRLFLQRRAIKTYPKDQATTFDGHALHKQLEQTLGKDWTELKFAQQVLLWLEDEQTNIDQLDLAARYGAWAVHHLIDTILFKEVKKLDFDHLIDLEIINNHISKLQSPQAQLRTRHGFGLTDQGASLAMCLDQAGYCIYCHHQGRDSCAKGMRAPDQSFKKNNFDVALTGCPLEEKISEMNELKASGHLISALATAMIDNPMLAATGHRICNDCMKSCIYQKQEPVNIPQIETRVLKDVLGLEWGFEIYSLLSRWNPLNINRPVPKKQSNYNVLVVGLGPAGFTLAHHLLNDGHNVVAIDGLKIEPLPDVISGPNFGPIQDINQLFEELDARVAAGFGGVAEYGITVRWNKNYLKLIRLLLERRAHFAMYGGVRFGGAITYNSAFALGFDHIALATGAGKPTLVEMKNPLARGIRTASDFLMSLQLTGSAREESIACLQIRMPIVVIGGGLTAIDTATESLAYYPIQVEKFLARYEILCQELGTEIVRQAWNTEEKIIADEFINHAQALRKSDDKLKLLQSWGGATIIYRKALRHAPSYRLNHEEVELAMQEGIFFAQELSPLEAVLDEFGHVSGLKVIDAEHKEILVAAKTILIAAGTSPNTILAREDEIHFKLDGKYFKVLDEHGQLVSPEKSAKPQETHVLLSIDPSGKAVSLFGDLHPSFAGNVVKAMASAKKGYPILSRLLHQLPPRTSSDLFARLHELLTAEVKEVIRLSSNIVEVVIKAPLAARSFLPGQFYRLQNFASTSQIAMEGLALTGASVDKEQGHISLIALEMGGSSNLCANLVPGEKVVLMGPTGTATEITAGQTVLLIGGGLGNAVLFSIGKAFRDKGSKVLYFAGYRGLSDRYKCPEIEAAADLVVWCCDEGFLSTHRDQDQSFHGNIIEAISSYASRPMPIDLQGVDRIIAIGSDKMMQAFNAARTGRLNSCLGKAKHAIASINSPMQCMMKEICGQCLQRHIDPDTGLETYVYSCAEQDQDMNTVDFAHLDSRLKQNSLQEKLTHLWLNRQLNAT